MGIAFTAIDFETANGHRGSPCAVGLVKVRDGQVVDQTAWLMRPPPAADHFEPANIAIHGITAADVAGEQTTAEALGRIERFVDGDLMVAHNAAFDLGVYTEAARSCRVTVAPARSACTVRLARRTYRLPSYSLPFVAAEAGVPLLRHHDPLEDARACAGIMIDVARRHAVDDLTTLFSRLALPATAWGNQGVGSERGTGPQQLALFTVVDGRFRRHDADEWPARGRDAVAVGEGLRLTG
ncbi:hypothetical protein BKD30_01615 [Tersicoccus phoenicis]|uniref:Exonuclease domain-containing protein n=1 Tax=Tersicoccus phoenicis TaxID=554083 RepID=A0A1R1LL39_9MICC|nr:3'-5' exonuclease [Tersicoccus phoenicis]OMH28250.1 hypothetical protein BKD30_01615 [Tersicoccus phoenicis]